MCFGSGSNTETRVVQQQSNLPAWAEAAGQSNYEQAKKLTARDYPVYSDPRIAGFTPDQMTAFEKIRNNQGSWAPSMAAAQGAVDQASASFDQADLQKYINPFTQMAIDPVVDQINRQYDRGATQRDMERAKLGTWGNDRNAVGDAMANRERDNLIAQVVGQGYSKAFSDAMGQYNVDKTRNLQVADAYTKLGGAQSQLNYADAAAMLQAGEQQRTQDQAGLSMKYEDFLKQFYYPQEQLNFLTSVTAGAPMATGSQTTQPVPVGSGTAQSIGALASLIGAGSMFKNAFF